MFNRKNKKKLRLPKFYLDFSATVLNMFVTAVKFDFKFTILTHILSEKERLQSQRK